MRVAVFSPLPPAPTGVADYSQLLLEQWGARNPDLIVEAVTGVKAPKSSSRFETHRADTYELASETVPIYQMGNSFHHDFIYSFAFRQPGVLVLHDLVLHHSRLASYLNQPEVIAYRTDIGDEDKREKALARMKDYHAEVEATYPDEGTSIAEVAVRTGGGRILYAYPLFELLARASKMTMVHSHTAREQVMESCPEIVVRRVRMGIDLPDTIERGEARRRLELSPSLMLASFGLVTPEKRISAALRCLKRLIDDGMDVDYYLVGGAVSHYDALAEARELGIADRVHQTGRVSEEDLWLYVFAADICFNLRYPSAGETSATLLRLLAAGRAVMVTDQIHTLDFPDSVVSRVALEGDEDGLYCDVRELLRHPRRRAQLEASSRKFISEEHNVDVMVDDYTECILAVRGLSTPDVALPPHLTP